MLYRIVHWINRWYALGVLWLFVGAFVLAAALLFIFPPGTLGLLFISLAGLGAAAIGSRILRALEQKLVRRSLRLGVCPQCRRANQPYDSENQDDWRCGYCDAAYARSGEPSSPQAIDQQESLPS